MGEFRDVSAFLEDAGRDSEHIGRSRLLEDVPSFLSLAFQDALLLRWSGARMGKYLLDLRIPEWRRFNLRFP